MAYALHRREGKSSPDTKVSTRATTTQTAQAARLLDSTDTRPNTAPATRQASTNTAAAPATAAAAERLCAVRQSLELSLADVPAVTGGRFTAAAVGSWERGFRGPTVERLVELCGCYQVRLTQVLTGEEQVGAAWCSIAEQRPGVDLESLAGEGGPEARTVRCFAASVAARRARFGAGSAAQTPVAVVVVVAIREGDYDVLALALDTTAEGLRRRMTAG